MSGTLTASFRLTLQDQLSSPLAKLMQRIEQLQRLASGISMGGLDKAEQTLNGAAAGADRVTRSLGRTEEAVKGVSSGARAMGGSFKAATSEASAGIDSLQRKLSAISGADLTRAVRTANAPMSDIKDNPGSYGSQVRGAAQHFQESTEQAGGRAFGAAMAGFGLIEPIREAADFDNTMRHIAITFGLSGRAGDQFVTSFSRSIDQLALQTGQSSRSLADAAGYLSREDFSASDIRTILPGIARISTAYNASPDAVAQTAFALQENMHVSKADLPGALASLARAGKQADLSFEELAPLFPNLAPALNLIGVGGRRGVDETGALLDVIRRSSGTPGETITKATDLIQSFGSNYTARRFKKYGVDIYKVQEDDKKSGKNPLLDLLSIVDRLSNHGQNLKVIGSLFHNLQDRGAAIAKMLHEPEFQKFLAGTTAASPKMLDTDFGEGSKSLTNHLGKFSEAITQIVRRIGYGFAPIMDLATAGLTKLVGAIDWMDQHLPGFNTGVLAVTGGALALATGLGVAGAFGPFVIRGWQLMAVALRPLAPLMRLTGLAFRAMFGGGFIALSIAAIADVIGHWSRFKTSFEQIWTGIKQVFHGNIFAGLGNILGGEFNILKQLCIDFLHWIDTWSGGLATSIAHGLAAGLSPLPSLTTIEHDAANSWVGRHLGLGDAPVSPTHKVELHVTADPGVRVTQRATSPAVTVTGQAVARGPMTSRP